MDTLQELGKHSILMDHDMILQYCPYYFEIRNYLKGIILPCREEVLSFVQQKYQEFPFYRKLSVLSMHEDEIRLIMERNADFKYHHLIHLIVDCIDRSIQLCDLIEYIGYYPKTYPIPKDSEKKPDLENLMEKYDIIVRYCLEDDIDKMQVSSNDIFRLVDTLNRNLEVIRAYLQSNKACFLRSKINDEEYERNMTGLKSSLVVPLSNHQMQGKSRRAEAIHYLKMRYGNLEQFK